jgi:hypothetical protein
MDEYKVTFTLGTFELKYVFKIKLDTPTVDVPVNGVSEHHVDNAQLEEAIKEALNKQVGVGTDINIQKIEKL